MFAAIMYVPPFSPFQRFKSPDSIKHSPALAISAIAECGRLGSLLVFVFVWSTIVYDPIACWTSSWGPSGWSAVLGSLDFAGGTPVHINSGTAALAIFCISVDVVDLVQRDQLLNLKIRVKSFSVLYCFGLDGSGSMELSGLISELSRSALSRIRQFQLAV